MVLQMCIYHSRLHRVHTFDEKLGSLKHAGTLQALGLYGQIWDTLYLYDTSLTPMIIYSHYTCYIIPYRRCVGPPVTVSRPIGPVRLHRQDLRVYRGHQARREE